VDSHIFNALNAGGLTLLLLLEVRSRTFRQVLGDPRRMRRNLAFLLSSVLTGLLLHRALVWLVPVLPQLSLRAPLCLQIPAVFLLGELFNWALHYAKHKSAFLWRIHCPHHKEDHYTMWLTVHTYGPEVLVSGTLMNALLLMAGFDLRALEIYLLFYSLNNAYQHSALPHSLGFLDALIVSPAYHRHHHGGDQVNFGSTLTIWDWVFRTAQFPTSRFEAVNPPLIEQTPEPFGFREEMLYPLIPSRWVESNPAARAPRDRELSELR
jgi:sterol desaturase/sphingolipid hydroxylase (fatty acid hydroxylase superfamily)